MLNAINHYAEGPSVVAGDQAWDVRARKHRTLTGLLTAQTKNLLRRIE